MPTARCCARTWLSLVTSGVVAAALSATNFRSSRSAIMTKASGSTGPVRRRDRHGAPDRPLRLLPRAGSGVPRRCRGHCRSGAARAAAAAAVRRGAGAFIVGAQPAINVLAATLYPTALRATGVGWTLGVGRVGSIVGPVAAAQLLALHWSLETLFVAGAVPAAFSSVLLLSLWRVADRPGAPSLAS
jgi:hypothetical protein